MADTIYIDCIKCGNKMDSIPQLDKQVCDDCKEEKKNIEPTKKQWTKWANYTSNKDRWIRDNN